MEKSEQMKIKQRIKLKITPVSLVPIATGAAFLILGTKSMDSCPGHPSLPEMLHIAGTSILSLGVMANVGKLIVAYGLPSDRPFTKEEKNVVKFFRLIRHFLTLSQIIILITGTIIIAPLASTIHPWNWKDPKNEWYCDYSLVIFSATFFPMMWFLLLFAIVAFSCIKCSNFDKSRKPDSKIKIDVEKADDNIEFTNVHNEMVLKEARAEVESNANIQKSMTRD